MRSMKGMDAGEPGPKRARIPAEALDRVVPALPGTITGGDHGDRQISRAMTKILKPKDGRPSGGRRFAQRS